MPITFASCRFQQQIIHANETKKQRKKNENESTEGTSLLRQFMLDRVLAHRVAPEDNPADRLNWHFDDFNAKEKCGKAAGFDSETIVDAAELLNRLPLWFKPKHELGTFGASKLYSKTQIYGKDVAKDIVQAHGLTDMVKIAALSGINEADLEAAMAEF